MVEIEITRQCKVELEFSSPGEALVYLYHYEKKIGLFDKHGFHFMTGHEVPETYRVEDTYKAHEGITWFRVFEKRSA